MTRTRMSLYYLAAYLPVAGLALLLVPDFATKLLLSNRTYDDVFTRLTGAVLLALAVLVIQIVRHRIEVLYPWTLVVRLGLLAAIGYLFAKTADPFFAVLLVVVGFGVVLTGWAYFSDRRVVAAE